MGRVWFPRVVRCALATIVPLATLGVAAFRLPRQHLPEASQTLEQRVGYSPERWGRLLRAQRAAVSACMKRRGYDFAVEPDPYYETAPHGLFDLDTVSAEQTYLSRRGLGVVAIADALGARSKSHAHARDQDGSTAARRRGLLRALEGDGAVPGCASAAVFGLPRGFLPDGGALGGAYADSWSAVRSSSAYEAWRRDVAACITAHGVPLWGGDPASAARPVLVRLIRATGGDASTDASGRLHFSIDAAGLTPRALAKLPAIGRAEHRVAEVELGCRKQFASAAHTLSLEAAGDLAEKYSSLVDRLRLALYEASKTH